MSSYRRTLLQEDIQKGLFLGLCHVFVVNSSAPLDLLLVSATVTSAVVMGLWLEKRRQPSQNPGPKGRWLMLALLGILDHPNTTSLAMVVGLALGILIGPGFSIVSGLSILVGAGVGLALHATKRVRTRWIRRTAEVCLAFSLAGVAWLGHEMGWTTVAGPVAITAAALVITGIGFHVLAFAGRDEETELEIAVPCIALSLAMASLNLPPLARGAVVLLPLGLFVLYCERIRKHLVVFKHVLRGLGHEQQGNLRDALWYYRQALKLEPNSEMAVTGNWRVHRRIDPRALGDDPELLSMIDPLVCLNRAKELLASAKPTSETLEEADKLLDIVEYHRPDLALTTGFHRLQVQVVEGDTERPHSLFRSLIDRRPADTTTLPSHEADALFRIWSLALQNPKLIAAGSLRAVDEGEGLFDLMAVVARRLRDLPTDPEAIRLRPFLYDKVTLKSYQRYADSHPDDTMEWFDHRHCWELARVTAGQGGTSVERAVELLRIAEDGLPDQRLVLWHTIARLVEIMDLSEALVWHQRVKGLGQNVGQGQLTSGEADAFFGSIRFLADHALATGEREAAIENLEIYSRYSKSGVDTLRTLKELYESIGQPAFAIRSVEAALAYSLGERQKKEWTAEKARLYREVSLQEVQGNLRDIERYFDFGYCYRRAKSLFDTGGNDADAMHDLEIAALGGREYLLAVNYLLGRCHWKEGRTTDAVLCWEAVRASKPDRFADKDQEDAYFQSCRYLGDAYLDTLDNPEKAIECYSLYKDYVKSGADTLFKLATAYERNGQPAHARKWYDMVLVYPSHPKAGSAREALARLPK